jgi:hypothetical protein
VALSLAPALSRFAGINKKPANLVTGCGQVPDENGLAVTCGRASRRANCLRRLLSRLVPEREVHPTKLRRLAYRANTFVIGLRGRRQAQVRVRRLSTSRENSLRAADPCCQRRALGAFDRVFKKTRTMPGAVISRRRLQVKQRMTFAGEILTKKRACCGVLPRFIGEEHVLRLQAFAAAVFGVESQIVCEDVVAFRVAKFGGGAVDGMGRAFELDESADRSLV